MAPERFRPQEAEDRPGTTRDNGVPPSGGKYPATIGSHGPPPSGRMGADGKRSTVVTGKGADMTDKSPRKTASKKSGKTLKEKRQAKKDKVQAHKPLVR